jgi:phosphohistidine phosphatase SixA
MRAAVLFLLTAATCAAQTLSGGALIEALQKGGYTIVMRHAASPRNPPDLPNADNPNRERQLDETGRVTATAMGQALRDLRIPVGEVFSSPAYRALETVRLAQLGSPTVVEELGDGGQSMSASSAHQAEWLRARVKQTPRSGNTILVTHQPNLSAAFPEQLGVADGEALIFAPGGVFVARVKIEDWPRFRR